MTIKNFLLAALAAGTLATPALAGSEIRIEDAYARAAGAMAVAGGAFFTVENTGNEDDRLIAVETPIAKRAELHTHIAEGDVMRMVEVEEGFAVPAGGQHVLASGGDHVMLMGLTEPLVEGAMITFRLTFEKAGVIEVQIPVDLRRGPGMPGMSGMGN